MYLYQTVTAFLADELHRPVIPTLRPTPRHAVYIDAQAFLPHIPRLGYPAQALCIELYRQGRLRTAELGSVTFWYGIREEERAAWWELVHLAPEGLYPQPYGMCGRCGELCGRYRESVQGLRIVEQPPTMRNFGAKFEPLLKEPTLC